MEIFESIEVRSLFDCDKCHLELFFFKRQKRHRCYSVKFFSLSRTQCWQLYKWQNIWIDFRFWREFFVHFRSLAIDMIENRSFCLMIGKSCNEMIVMMKLLAKMIGSKRVKLISTWSILSWIVAKIVESAMSSNANDWFVLVGDYNLGNLGI